jgi:poly-gamma-glutamate synthesis protein (capsule biosynthesis protein)
LVTSNNHSLDSGLTGVTHTIDVIRKNGFLHTGTFKNKLKKEMTYPLIIYKNGFKLAILNSTHHTNGFRTPTPSVVNRLDMAEIKKDLDKARAMKADFIITFLHWGDEHQLNESANQREVAKLLHLWGSDLVVGAHPHVVQPIKNELVTHNKKQYRFLTAYSLGNFISSQPFPNTEGGIVFEVDIKKQNGVLKIENFAYIPIIRYTPFESGKIRYYALPISPFEGREKTINMSASEKSKMAAFAEKTRAHLNQFGVKEHTFALKDLLLDY